MGPTATLPSFASNVYGIELVKIFNRQELPHKGHDSHHTANQYLASGMFLSHEHLRLFTKLSKPIE